MVDQKYHLFFEIFANPFRMRIIEFLKDKEGQNVGDICKALKQEQSKVSHSIKRLLMCNIVTVSQKGNFRYYSLNKSTIAPLFKLIDIHVNTWCWECSMRGRKWSKN